MRSHHRKPINVCAIRGHFWRGVGSTRDLKQIMQVCQRCLVSRTVPTDRYSSSAVTPEMKGEQARLNGEISMRLEVMDHSPIAKEEEPCPPQAA
jgi:hypothetical protein